MIGLKKITTGNMRRKTMIEEKGNYDPENPLWVVVRYRDTGEIRCTGLHKVTYEKRNVARFGQRSRYKSFANQWDWIIPKPEAECIFIESHQIIRAKSAEQAVLLWRN